MPVFGESLVPVPQCTTSGLLGSHEWTQQVLLLLSVFLALVALLGGQNGGVLKHSTFVKGNFKSFSILAGGGERVQKI